MEVEIVIFLILLVLGLLIGSPVYLILIGIIDKLGIKNKYLTPTKLKIYVFLMVLSLFIYCFYEYKYIGNIF